METQEPGSFEPPRPDAIVHAAAPLPPPVPTSLQPPPFAPLHDTPTAFVVPAAPAPSRSKGKIIGGLVAIVALVGASGFAITRQGGLTEPRLGSAR